MFGRINWANLLAYEILPSDMELFQAYMLDYLSQYLGGTRSPGVISGGQIAVTSGLQFTVSAGVAITPSGQLFSFPMLSGSLAAADVSNPRIDRIELASLLTNNTAVVDINSQAKVLDLIYTPSTNIVIGTPSASPVVPTQTSANVSIGYITVSAGQAALIIGNVTQAVDGGFQTSALLLGNKNSFIRFNQTLSLLQFSNDGVRYSALGSGGGGGGAGAAWEPVDGLAPISVVEYNEKSYTFDQNGGQSLSLAVKVPSSYLAGSPITMRVSHYSPSAAGTWKFQALATLIRSGVDALSSTANQFSSTNGDMANAVANQLRSVTYNLSTLSGALNGVNASPGDLLIITLTRISPSGGTEDTGSVRMIPSTTETAYS